MSRTVSREDLNDEVLVPRLQREKAKTGTITASLLWNGKSDLDLHGFVTLESSGKTEHCFYSTKKAGGGELDVDANAREGEALEEPVENIFWKKPPAGNYEIEVRLYALRGGSGPIPFRVQLKLPDETLDYEGSVSSRGQTVKCFKFSVDGAGEVTVGSMEQRKVMRKPSGLPAALGGAVAMRAMKMVAMKKPAAMKAVVKAVMKPMKKKVVSIKRQRELVFKGDMAKTKTGLKKDAFTTNKAGKIVSKKMSDTGKTRYKTHLKAWVDATVKARAELGITGFYAIKKGTPLYKRTKEIYDSSS